MHDLENDSSPPTQPREDAALRRGADDAMRAANPAHFAALVSSSPDAIISTSFDGTILSWNAAARRLLGFRAEEMIGRSIVRVIPLDHLQQEAGVSERLHNGERIDPYETVRLDALGRKKDVSRTIWPIRDETGAIVAMGEIVRDVAARKRIERALRRRESTLRQSRQRLRHALGVAGLTYADIDLTGQRVLFGENFSQVMGYAPPRPARGAKLSDVIAPLLANVVLQDRQLVLGALDDALAGKMQGVAELRVLGDDGASPRSVKATWDVEAGADVWATRVFVTGQDVTGLVEERSPAAIGEAERADKTRVRFLAAAGHDLRQPVQALVLVVGALARQMAEGSDATEAMDTLKLAVEGLRGLLAGIFDISRLDAGALAPVFESVDLRDLVCRLASEYAAKAAAKGLDFRVVARGFRVRTDPHLLERALRNLIENALRFTIKGGILLGMRRHGRFVKIVVVDTGIGVAPDKQIRIFEEFFQVAHSGGDLDRGLGMGLTIVVALANVLGAEVAIASKLGRGSRFSLSLPYESGPIAAIATH